MTVLFRLEPFEVLEMGRRESTLVRQREMTAPLTAGKALRRALRATVYVALPALALATAGFAQAQSLRGSSSSLDRQVRQAEVHDYSRLRDANHVQRFVDAGLLVPVVETPDYWLKAVSFPVARPAVKLFIERLASQYRAACGERLVVTSLTRPLANQPRNASRRSVHPTGMALDLRRPFPGPCRDWLEETLLYLEGRKVLEATRETSPAHYHIALFPQPYVSHVARLTGLSPRAITASLDVDDEPTTYTVRRSDTLWQISRRYDTTPRAIQLANGLRSTEIFPGQQLKIPAGQR
jgi:hypothetical protein